MKYLLTLSTKNEEESISYVIKEFYEEAKKLNISLYIHVIDDHSNDKTCQRALKSGATIFYNDGKGLASAFKKEMEVGLKTDADFFIHIDADGQHSPSDLHKFISMISEGYDLILGNRLHIRPNKMSFFHFAGNIVLSKIISILATRKISDSQTGYRLLNRKVAEYCKCESSTFTYTQELIIRASVQKFCIGEVPVYIRERQYGTSRLVKNPLTYSYRVLNDLLKLIFDIKLFSKNSCLIINNNLLIKE